MTLDEFGRCCGRKPLVYKTGRFTSSGPYKFCGRCHGAFNLETGEQIPNWAWRRSADETEFVRISDGGKI